MNDVLGHAIKDYWEGDTKTKLWVLDHLGPKVEMQKSIYFRAWNDMPELEKKAIQLCTGKILDVGAGAGSHSLELQKKHTEVYAMDISPLNCEVIKARGVKNVIQSDFFKYQGETFDTLLLIMNGVGICGSVAGFTKLLNHFKKILKPNGKVIMDSSDLAYLYDKDTAMPLERYYGEIECAYSYKGKMTNFFTWLYLDFYLMKAICDKNGWICTKLFDDGQEQFLVSLQLA